jgi:hypothetical protein
MRYISAPVNNCLNPSSSFGDVFREMDAGIGGIDWMGVRHMEFIRSTQATGNSLSVTKQSSKRAGFL